MTEYGWMSIPEGSREVWHLYEILPGPPRAPLCWDKATEVEHDLDGRARCVRCRRVLTWMEIY